MKKILIVTVILILSTSPGYAEKVLKVGIDGNFPPFAYTEENGEFTGFDPDLMAAISREAGFQYQFVRVPFQNILSDLQMGRLDMGMSAFSITEDRRLAFDFSNEYYRTGIGILVPRESPIEGIKDLNGMKVAVRSGTVSVPFASSLTGTKLSIYMEHSVMVKDLLEGVIDAVITDNPAVAIWIRDTGTYALKRVGKVYEEQAYGIAFRKNSKLKAVVNAALTELKKNGEYAKIYQKWLGYMSHQ